MTSSSSSASVLKLVIVHAKLGNLEPFYIKIEEILEWLQDETEFAMVSANNCRPYFGQVLRASACVTLPFYGSKLCDGPKATMVLKEQFLADCMIAVFDAEEW